ncbi:MAG TPA: hypothetical protein VGK90_08780 [Rhizomicrobium sp.]|jgi:hypothetical protein
MHRVDALVLGMFFTGGAVLALGSILGSVKRAFSDPGIAQFDSPDEVIPQGLIGHSAENTESSERDAQAQIESVPLQALATVVSKPAQPHSAGVARPGKNKKKFRQTSDRKNDRQKMGDVAQRKQRKNKLKSV